MRRSLLMIMMVGSALWVVGSGCGAETPSTAGTGGAASTGGRGGGSPAGGSGGTGGSAGQAGGSGGRAATGGAASGGGTRSGGQGGTVSPGTGGSAGAGGAIGWSCLDVPGELCFCNTSPGDGEVSTCSLSWTCCFSGSTTSCECIAGDEAACQEALALDARVKRVARCPP